MYIFAHHERANNFWTYTCVVYNGVCPFVRHKTYGTSHYTFFISNFIFASNFELLSQVCTVPVDCTLIFCYQMKALTQRSHLNILFWDTPSYETIFPQCANNLRLNSKMDLLIETCVQDFLDFGMKMAFNESTKVTKPDFPKIKVFL